MVFAIFSAVFLVLPLGLVGLGGWRTYQNAALRSRGASVMGRVAEVDQKSGTVRTHGRPAVEVRTRYGRTVTTVEYAYEVEGQVHFITATMPGIVTAKSGDETEIVYLPEKPAAGVPRFVLNRPFHEADGFYLYLIGGILLLVGVPFGVWELRPYLRRRRLLKSGLPSVATLSSVAPRDRTKFRANYSFATRAGTHEGTAVVTSRVAELLKKSKQAAVFFDPEDVARSDLYVSMADSYRIVDEPR
jgi:hypothetical protein